MGRLALFPADPPSLPASPMDRNADVKDDAEGEGDGDETVMCEDAKDMEECVDGVCERFSGEGEGDHVEDDVEMEGDVVPLRLKGLW